MKRLCGLLILFCTNICYSDQIPPFKESVDFDYWRLFIAFILVVALLVAAVYFLQKKNVLKSQNNDFGFMLHGTFSLSRTTFVSLVTCKKKDFMIVHNASSCSVQEIDSNNKSL